MRIPLWQSKCPVRVVRFGVTAVMSVVLGIVPPCSAQRVPHKDPVPLQNWSLRKAADAASSSTSTTADEMTGLVFIATAPCRMADTRTEYGMTGAFGPPALKAMAARKFVVPNAKCGLPVAAAYSLNIVSVTEPGVPVGWVDAWSGDVANWPGTVVLNAVQGGIVNAPAVVAAGVGGTIQVQASNDADLVIDVNGYWIERTTMKFRGRWSASLAYLPGDVVTQTAGGWGYGTTSTYVALTTNSGIDPQSSSSSGGSAWQMLASAGTSGVAGASGPQGPQGATGTAGAAGTSRYLLTSNFSTAAAATPSYLPLTGSGDPTTIDNTFSGQASVIPVACSIKHVTLFNSANSATGIDSVTILRSVAGTGMPSDLGVSLSAVAGASDSATMDIPIAAGDTLAYVVTLPAGGSALSASISLLCQ
jgi:hypothetical protein